jgi:hypothetical protein
MTGFAVVVGCAALAFGLYSVIIWYRIGTMIMGDVHPELRDLSREQWGAIETSLQAGIIQIAAPLFISILAFLAAMILGLKRQSE